MSKKIFFVIVTCCLLVAMFCFSFAGAPQVQSVVEPFSASVSSDSSFLLYDLTAYASEVYHLETNPMPYPAGLFGFDSMSFDGSFDGVIYFVGFGTDEIDVSFSYEAFDPAGNSINMSLFQLTSLPFSEVTYDDSFYLLSLLHNDYYVEFYLDLDEFQYQQYVPLVFRASGTFYAQGSGDVTIYSFDGTPYVDFIVDVLVSGLRSLGINVGEALSEMATAIFINAEGTGLSVFGVLIAVFAAISLGLSLTRWVLNFVTSWGNRNR